MRRCTRAGVLVLALIAAAAHTTAAQSQTTQYVYDAVNRIVEVRYPDRVIHYTYDAAGNRLSVTVAAAPVVNVQPVGQTITFGISAQFTVSVSGSPTPAIQWQSSSDGGVTWFDIADVSPYSGSATATLTITAPPVTLNGTRYRAAASNSAGSVTSDVALLTIRFAPIFTLQPVDHTVSPGQVATFMATATGNPAPTYQWQVSTNQGATFSNITDNGSYSGASTSTLTVAAANSLTGFTYRCVATNAIDSVASSGAVLVVQVAPTFTTQPSDQTVVAGSVAAFVASVAGTPAPSVQWQVSSGGGSFADIPGATSAGYSFTALAAHNGQRYQVVATNAAGSATSSVARLTVNSQPSVSSQPVDASVNPGQTARFAVVVDGFPSPAIQWQVSTDAGTTFSNLSATAPYGDPTAAALVISNVPLAFDGYRYRAMAVNSVGSAVSASAILHVGLPTVAVDRTSLVFSATSKGSAFTSQTGTQAIRLTQTGTGAVSWTATSNAPWLKVANGSGAPATSAAGTGSATLNLSVAFAAGLSAANSGSVALAFTGSGNSAGPITVTLNVYNAGSTAPPFGSFDTPASGTTGITGSVAVTGWAIDDVGVQTVAICRDAVQGETATVDPKCNNLAKIFLGTAVLVDGARTDVAASYPNYPVKTRAGWGYLMLTNFLPNQGNGSFVLHAYVTDVDGHTVELGTGTPIACTNDKAVTPFGAIDTPGQGDTVSGSITNFGWTLVRGTSDRADSPGGATVNVVIDGAAVGMPGGWTSRSDISGLFPTGYNLITSAVANFAINTTTLTNGVHTIAWGVTSKLGQGAGIGSRYFTVSNGALYLDPTQGVQTTPSLEMHNPAAMLAPRTAMVRMYNTGSSLSDEVDAAPYDGSSIQGRRGFDLDALLQPYRQANGLITIQSEELDRIELHLSSTAGHNYTGYLRIPGGIAPLPIGSTLDPATGTFTWQPGVGFVGPYDFVFVRWGGGRAVARQEVRIVLNPKGSGRVGPQVVIDTPRSQQDVAQPFTLAGWAADLDSTIDDGVDTVHVWAYPLTGEDPIFLGAASFGGVRPDVAAVYGDRFKTSGYGLIVDGLVPGNYDIAVFAYSTVQGGFVPAKVVRLTVR